MKKMMAISMASAMLFAMGTAAFADIETGIVGSEKSEWPNEFGFGGEIKLVRGEEVKSFALQEKNEMDLQPGDDLYIPLYYKTKEGEQVTIGASKEQMTGYVPYTGGVDKSWRLNFIDKTKDMMESAELYRADSGDKHLVKHAVYVKVQTNDHYGSLEDLKFDIGVSVSEKYTQNKTAQIQFRGTYGNPKSETMVDFEWENSVFDKAVWEVSKDQDGTATFRFHDDAYYTVRMFGGDKVLFDFDRSYNKEIANRYNEDLYFYNFRGDLDSFHATGTLSIPVEQPMYLYEVVNGALKATNAVYNEELEVMEFKTKRLGEYVLTPSKLAVDSIPEEAPQQNQPEQDADQEATEQTPSIGEEQQTGDYLGGGDKLNPSTGAQQLTGLAAALAVVSLAGALALAKRK
jgi:hypothetical protein